MIAMQCWLSLSLLLLWSSSVLSVSLVGIPVCPPIEERSAAECVDAVPTCWALDRKDTDCPNNGLCCFDGCVASCLKPAIFNQVETAGDRKAKARHFGPPVHPSLGRVITSCPPKARKSPYECRGRQTHTCWSVNQPDVDCPGHGLCCFDGCANTCLSDVRARVPQPPQVIKNEDPCHPSPCGQGTTCTVNANLDAVCQCLPGLVPKPDTISGCGPECLADSDCRYGLICRDQRCIERPDPCNPSPCGPGTTCTESRDGNPICQCEHGLIPKPDTITGCGPECQIDPDCQHGFVCKNQRCIVRPDPCKPKPCGPRTTCVSSRDGNPICRCLPGYVPKPDTITGCGPECVIDSDCRHGYVCERQKCVEKPDPCQPSPCGRGTTCREGAYGNAICECLPGLIPKPDTVTGCGPECTRDNDCGFGFICQNQKCIEKPDPCDPSPCGPGAFCMVNSAGNAICKCEEGLVPMPDSIIACGPECRIDPDCEDGFICVNQRCVEKPDPCRPSPCGPGAFCTVNPYGNPICKCKPGLIPKPDTITGCGPECEIDPDCEYGYICKNNKCVEKPDPCNPNPCGMMAICTPRGLDDFTCSCPKGTFGDPYAGCIEGECQDDDDCALDKACIEYYCLNPCLTNSTCTAQDFCQVRNHIPVCGFNYDEPPLVRSPVVVGGKYEVSRPGAQGRTSAAAVGGVSGRRRLSSPRTLRRNPTVIGARYRAARKRRSVFEYITKMMQ